MEKQENDKPQDSQSHSLRPEDVRYDLTSGQLNAYLERVRPDGYACPVCGHKKWGAAERGFPDGASERSRTQHLKKIFSNWNFHRLPECSCARLATTT